jgi:hypothetical protein
MILMLGPRNRPEKAFHSAYLGINYNGCASLAYNERMGKYINLFVSSNLDVFSTQKVDYLFFATQSLNFYSRDSRIFPN